MNPKAVLLYSILAAWAVFLGAMFGLFWAAIPLALATAVFVIVEIL